MKNWQKIRKIQVNKKVKSFWIEREKTEKKEEKWEKS